MFSFPKDPEVSVLLKFIKWIIKKLKLGKKRKGKNIKVLKLPKIFH